MNKLIEDKINELRYQTDDSIKDIELAHIPYAYYLKYKNVDKYTFDGREYDYSETFVHSTTTTKHLILAHNLPFTFQTRNNIAYMRNVKELIKTGEMIPFLLFVKGKFIKWSDITIIRDYRYSYIMIDNVEYDRENDSIVCVLAPFNIEYKEGISIDKFLPNTLYFDYDGKFTSTNAKIVYTSITILEENTTLTELRALNSGFRFKIKYEGSNELQDPDDLIYNLEEQGMTPDLASIVSYVMVYEEDGTSHKVEVETAKDFQIQTKEYGQLAFIENCLIFKNGLLAIDLRELCHRTTLNFLHLDAKNVSVNVFTYNKSPKSLDLIYKIPNSMYVKSIIDSDDTSILDPVKDEQFNFSFNKKKSYKYNLEQAFKYISNYDFNLFNDIIKSQSKIESFTYSGKKLKSLMRENNYFYIPRIIRKYNTIAMIDNGMLYDNNISYCMIFINNKLYKYHYMCLYTPMYYKMYIPDRYINDDDKIEIIHYTNIDNSIYRQIVNNSNLLLINENFISNIELYCQGIENQLYDLDNVWFQTKLDFSYNKESEECNWYKLSIDEKYYDKEIVTILKNRFAYLSTCVEHDGVGIELNLREDFLYCRNKKQYMIFIDGKLLSQEYYELYIPEKDLPIDDMSIYFSIILKKNSRVDIFYIPLEFTTLIPEYTDNGYMTVDVNKLHYPLDKDCFFYFINGKKVFPNDITNISKNTIKVDIDMESMKDVFIFKHINEIEELSNVFSNTTIWDSFLSSLDDTTRNKLFNLTDIIQSNNEDTLHEETVSKNQILYELIAEYYLRNGIIEEDGTISYNTDMGESIIEDIDPEGNGIIGLVDAYKYDKADIHGTRTEVEDND